MRKTGLLTCVFLLFACAGVSRHTPANTGDHAPAIIASAAECAAQGGTWRRAGMRPTERCFLPTTDAGKPCRDDGECTSLCLAPEAARAGDHVVGRCYGTTEVPGGCLAHVRDGTAQAALCTD